MNEEIEILFVTVNLSVLQEAWIGIMCITFATNWKPVVQKKYVYDSMYMYMYV